MGDVKLDAETVQQSLQVVTRTYQDARVQPFRVADSAPAAGADPSIKQFNASLQRVFDNAEATRVAAAESLVAVGQGIRQSAEDFSEVDAEVQATCYQLESDVSAKQASARSADPGTASPSPTQTTGRTPRALIG